MMMMGIHFMDDVPFKTVYLHAMVRDEHGSKMSKTKGNVIDPLQIMDDIGADALRFALINGAAPGADQRLGPSRLEGARNFANKLWNAARFVIGARPAELPDDAILALPEGERLGPAEHWILSRCDAAVRDAEAAYASFQFAEASRILHTAIWSEYCDWYLEMAKVRLGADADPAARVATWQVLAWVLDRYLRMLHPVMPHITEEIWGRLPHRLDDGDLLITAEWPAVGDTASGADEAQASAVADILELVTQIRNARADAGTEPGTWLRAQIRFDAEAVAGVFEALSDTVARLARIRPTLAPAAEPVAEDAAALVVVTRGAEARLWVSAEDRERDRARLQKELEETERLLASTRFKLANEAFVSRAPSHVVEGVRASEAELQALSDRLREHLAR
jgi:valyl-tRNA synthetase